MILPDFLQLTNHRPGNRQLETPLSEGFYAKSKFTVFEKCAA